METSSSCSKKRKIPVAHAITTELKGAKQKRQTNEGNNSNSNNMNNYTYANSPRLLDLNIPEEKRRIQQRKRDIAYGKNTIGYDEYIKKIPQNKRKFNNMETPMTPNPEEDIPARRWQGKVKAWRKALHKYDPPEYGDTRKAVESSTVKADNNGKERTDSSQIVTSSFESLGVLESKELHEASKRGLPVNFNLNPTYSKNKEYNGISVIDDEEIVFDEDDTDDDDDLL